MLSAAHHCRMRPGQGGGCHKSKKGFKRELFTVMPRQTEAQRAFLSTAAAAGDLGFGGGLDSGACFMLYLAAGCDFEIDAHVVCCPPLNDARPGGCHESKKGLKGRNDWLPDRHPGSWSFFPLF